MKSGIKVFLLVCLLALGIVLIAKFGLVVGVIGTLLIAALMFGGFMEGRSFAHLNSYSANTKIGKKINSSKALSSIITLVLAGILLYLWWIGYFRL